MSALTSSPAALRLFAVSIAARLPLAMLTIGMLVHVEAATESFAIAGLACGTLAVAQGIGGPLLGRLVDRRGQTAVLVVSALVAGAALAAVAALPADAPLAALLALAAVLGASTPPVAACMRALLPVVVRSSGDLRAAYAVDSAAVELTWISGPPLVLLVGAVWSTGAALTVAGALLVGSTLLFAAASASRSWRGDGSAAPTARTGTGLALLLASLAGAHLALAAAAGSLLALGAAIVLAGTLIAPTCATAYAMVDAVAPHGTVTEAFAWLATAVALGTSVGAAAAGIVADAGGAAPTFVLGGAAAAVVAVIAASRAHTVSAGVVAASPPAAPVLT